MHFFGQLDEIQKHLKDVDDNCFDTVINQGKSRRNSHDRVYSNFTLF